MRILFFTVFVLLVQNISSICTAQANCKSLLASPKITEIGELFERALSGESPWPGYNIAKIPIILFDSRISNSCALFKANDGTIKSFELTSLPMPENGIFGLCGGIYQPSCPSFVDKEGVKAAIIYNIADFFENAFKETKLKPSVIHFYVLSHEGFHFFAQFPIIPKPVDNWPKLSLGMGSAGRKQLEKRCYAETPEGVAIRKLESASLYDSLEELIVNRDLDKAKALSRIFLDYRRERYDLIRDILIEDHGEKINCPDAEVNMEMSEGLADFVAFKSEMIVDGLSELSALEFLEFLLKSRSNEGTHYYDFGNAQALLMALDKSNDWQRSVENIIQAKHFSELLQNEFRMWAY